MAPSKATTKKSATKSKSKTPEKAAVSDSAASNSKGSPKPASPDLDGELAPELSDDDIDVSPDEDLLLAEETEAELWAQKKPKQKKNAETKKAMDERQAQLIALGKSKGFLTYDEVNKHMPTDVVSSEQIDAWLGALASEGIEIVDSAETAKAMKAAKKEGTAKGATGGDGDDEEEEESDEDYAFARTADPVRMYLRKMGSVSLLTREGEVEIAKRIEEGERQVLAAALKSAVAVDELIVIGDRLKHGEVRVKDVVKDVDEEDVEFDEKWHRDRVTKVIDRIKKLQRDASKAQEQLTQRGHSEVKRKKLRETVANLGGTIFDELSDLRMNKNAVEQVVAKLKVEVTKIRRAEQEVRRCESRAGMVTKDLRKTIRELKGDPGKANRFSKLRGIELADLDEMDRIVKSGDQEDKNHRGRDRLERHDAQSDPL